MKFEIEVEDKELQDAVLDCVAQRYYAKYSADRRNVDKVVAQCIRDVIYKDKGRIVDMIVERASRECVNKTVKKILEKVMKDED